MDKSEININYIMNYNKSKCSYCNIKDSSSCGFIAKKILTETYENLINLGWRRCGNFYYNQNSKESCCIYYTIKVDALNFKLNKKQKKIDNLWNKFLNGEIDENKNELIYKKPKSNEKFILNEDIEKEIIIILEELKNNFKSNNADINLDLSKIKLYKNSHNNIYSNIFIIFKLINKNYNIDSNFTVDNKFFDIKIDEKNYLKFILKEKSIKKKISNKNMIIENKKKILELKLVPNDFTEEKYTLYWNYCTDIHKKDDKKSKKSFADFLCTKNLIEKDINNNGKILKLGSYHLDYYLDNKLIGVSVIDILPSGLSSVYFFYNSIYKKLRLGTYSVFKDIEYIKDLNNSFNNFKYYHLGYYIQNNIKMNYKINYEPCYLLCNKTFMYKWVDKNLKKEIEEKNYVEFFENFDNTNYINEDKENEEFIYKNLKLNLYNKIFNFKDLNFDPKEIINILKDIRLGRDLILNSIFVLN